MNLWEDGRQASPRGVFSCLRGCLDLGVWRVWVWTQCQSLHLVEPPNRKDGKIWGQFLGRNWWVPGSRDMGLKSVLGSGGHRLGPGMDRAFGNDQEDAGINQESTGYQAESGWLLE